MFFHAKLTVLDDRLDRYIKIKCNFVNNILILKMSEKLLLLLDHLGFLLGCVSSDI